MMFIRESRWAKLTGVVSTAAALVLLVGLGAFELGYYPIEMRYRVVNTELQFRTVDRALQTRLNSFNGFRGIEYDPSHQPTVVTVKTWKCYRDKVENLLSVQEVPQLVWIEASEATNEAIATVVPVVPGIDTSSFGTVDESLGTALKVAGEALELSPDLVGRVVTDGDGQSETILIELTPAGRQELAKLGGKNAKGGLGLVIEGLVEGIATADSISQRAISFQLSKESDHNHDSIAAGIRGPLLPTPLELLE